MTETQSHIESEQLPLTAPIIHTEGLPEKPSVSDDALRGRAHDLAQNWEIVRIDPKDRGQELRLKALEIRLRDRLAACESALHSKELTPTLELLESSRMLRAVLTEGESAAKEFAELPRVRVHDHGDVPRIMRVAEEYLDVAGGIWSAETLTVFTTAVQEHEALTLHEVWMLPIFLKLAQLEFILDRAEEVYAGEVPPIERSPFSAPLHSLRRLNQAQWAKVVEPIVPFFSMLARDPHNVFLRMDEETRGGYMERVAVLSKRSDCSEVEVARIAVELSWDAVHHPNPDPRLTRRMSHVGYYLFEEGLPQLAQRISYQPALREQIRTLIANNNEDFYVIGIFALSIATIAALILPVVPHHAFLPVIGAMLLALLPTTQGVIDLVNNAISSFLRPRALPKLDYGKGIPREATTLVVVPTLLLSEAQTIDLFEQLEARWLSNMDPNLHFGLLTDLPDSDVRPKAEDRNELVNLAVRLTDELNAKYAGERGGAFFLLHRHRVFNSRQGVWMGWERKRGKLLDLNKLLAGEFDSFPVKAGPTHILSGVRYIITLDSDTQLPRNTAARMIGTMEHPLNQAIIDPRRKIVTKGYGILQPRVGVSVASASRSRLASIFSGETGYDIYTRAVSDVYQDLFGEGIFTGKGIYEAAILHEVLDRRFPRNTLLSHDLIEGAYTRAGLVTDIEVIDDYPSHYSAHTRRKHRWVRGDWQILQWLFNKVPDESGRMVDNPISVLSQWKIFDNLRRSLVEPVTFILLVFAWLFLPGGARYWTFVILTLILLPVMVQLVFNLGRGLIQRNSETVLEAFRTFWRSLGFHLLYLAFLPHQTLMAIDAITRSLVRRFLTGRRLLEWETAAQAETHRSRGSLDLYLQLSPLVALTIGVLIALVNRSNLIVAAPILVLWALMGSLVAWLDSPPRRLEGPLSSAERKFLRKHALLIWRYYAEFGGEENQWLIPDNVVEQDKQQARTLSPTNLGMLLNSRQAALQLGFITLPEFARATRGTLTTYEKLEKVNGHIYNWIDMATLTAIPPFTISTVDSGNLAASLYALHGGLLDILKKPMLSGVAFEALHEMLGEPTHVGEEGMATLRQEVKWLFALGPIESRGEWMREEAEKRRVQLIDYVTRYLPWLLPKFESIFQMELFADPENDVMPAVHDAVQYAHALDERLKRIANAATGSHMDLAIELRALLPDAIQARTDLVHEIRHLRDLAIWHADAMRFDFLMVEARQLLSIGYEGRSHELYPSCYDLLASEARIATFLAIAKGDVPQRVWFNLGRAHTLVNGRAALLSWTGTMFEYMMPALWMRHYPNTLMFRSMEAAIAVQREHVKGIPWGISESGMAKRDAAGRYGYNAWGVPSLALKYGAEDGPVISPYSTFLALPFARQEALKNLRRMEEMGWVGDYGFYEAADYTNGASKRELVRSWMAHHQGMSLIAATNLLQGNAFQNWFHANPKVRAAELLLHERPLSKPALRELARSTAASSDRHLKVA